ncbi:hypothetical protein CAPN004_22300 [Capnocytophaga cynodegmi]|uniref:hypothetical protein n=1 Tax=Capnocytophaga TaxID=1016 RepID=UPI001ACCB1C6|nr:hypothetical protein [Capnocytophaga cynodegmi]GIM53200.1 hypothetical protein CAPN004_22300 [Capnocytophaga cynodegmi]
MQLKEAIKLKENWEKMGSKPCEHPNKSKEYFEGTATGDYVCTTCGEQFYENSLENEKKVKITNKS